MVHRVRRHHKILSHAGRFLWPFMFTLVFYSIGASADEPIFSRFIDLLTGSPLLVGILAAIAWITFTVLAEPAGSIIDKIGVKRAILLGGALDMIGFLVIYLTTSVYALAISLIISGAGAAFFWTASRTHTANFYRKKTGKGFGNYVASWGFGWAVGPLIGGALAFFFNIKTPFLFSAIILAISVLIFWRIIPDDKKNKHVGKTLAYELRGGFLRDGLLFMKTSNWNVKKIFLLQMLQYMVLETILIFAPLYFFQLNNAEIGIIFFVQSIVFAISSMFWGRLSDTASKPIFITTGFLITAGISLVLINLSAFWPILILASIFGLAAALIEPITDAMLNDSVNKTTRGVANGFSQAAYGVGGGIGPLIGGAVAAVFGLQSVFVLAGLLCIFGVGLGLSMRK